MKVGIVIAGNINYYYNVTGERTQEALQAAGHEADLFTLGDYVKGDTQRSYDVCLLVNTYDLIVGYDGTEQEAEKKLRQMFTNMGQVMAVGLEAAQTKWFSNIAHRNTQLGVNALLDYGFADQSKLLPRDFHMKYQFVMNGLTPSERADAEDQLTSAQSRPIPWAFVGHSTPERQNLIYQLTQEIARDGFVYIPKLEPVREDGPHINRQQLQAVLDKTKWFVWSAHHDHLYVEHVRFRQALESGALPLKIMQNTIDIPEEVPFQYLVVHIDDLVERLAEIPYEATRKRFIQDFLDIPPLEETLVEAIENLANTGK